MRILLCAATEMEIQPTIDHIREQGLSSIDILITGVGMMATSYWLTKVIHINKPDFILQAGVAGCLDNQLPLAEIVIVENENIGDLGVDEGSFKTLFDLKLLEKNSFPWKNGKLSNNVDVLKENGLTIVDGVTVNQISTDKERIAYYKDQLKASVESMEGAALHFVALQERIPFLQIRSLSNFAGERNKSKWEMGVAIENLNIELQRILMNLTSEPSPHEL